MNVKAENLRINLVLSVLQKSKIALYASQIARETKISSASIGFILHKLEEAGLVYSIGDSGIKFWGLNRGT